MRLEAHRKLKDDEAAQDDDARCRSTIGTTAWNYYLPGHSAGLAGDIDEAIRSYQAALRLQPNHYSALFYLANRLGSQKLKRYNEAIAISRACSALRPHRPENFGMRAACYRDLGNLEAAEEEFSAAIPASQIDDHRYFALNNRRAFYRNTGRMMEAQADSKQVIALCERASENVDREAAGTTKNFTDPINVGFEARMNHRTWRRVLACECFELADLLVDISGRGDEARSLYSKGRAIYENLLSDDLTDFEAQNCFAWHLTTTIDPATSDLLQAVELARRATAGLPKKAEFGTLLALPSTARGIGREQSRLCSSR